MPAISSQVFISYDHDDIRFVNRIMNSLQMIDSYFVIVGIESNLEAKIPSFDAVKLEQIVKKIEANFPVSKALSAIPITLKAKLI
jgi:organic hydroperoxide reductase OsmC/OhrA